MKKVILSILFVVIAGCTDVMPSSDSASAEEISAIITGGRVDVQIHAQKTAIITLISSSYFTNDERKRDSIADEVAAIVLKNNTKLAFITFVAVQQGSRGNLVATYSWRVENGELVPAERGS